MGALDCHARSSQADQNILEELKQLHLRIDILTTCSLAERMYDWIAESLVNARIASTSNLQALQERSHAKDMRFPTSVQT